MVEVATFPILRGLMAKYRLKQGDGAAIIGTSLATFNSKLNGQTEFKFSEMKKITEYFADKGEDVSAEKIFFN